MGEHWSFLIQASQRRASETAAFLHSFKSFKSFTGWWFQTSILFSISYIYIIYTYVIYGIMKKPLTNSIIFQDGKIAPPTSEKVLRPCFGAEILELHKAPRKIRSSKCSEVQPTGRQCHFYQRS